MKIKGKKAGTKLLSIWWFIILALVTVGIVIGVLVFLSNVTDVRLLEAEILSDKIFDCISQNSYISRDFLSLSQDKASELLQKCSLNFKDVEDTKSEEQYYVNIRVYDFDECSSSNLCKNVEPVKEISLGANKAKECGIKMMEKEGKKVEAKWYPECVENYYYVLNKDKPEKLIVSITTGIFKINKNVKVI